MLNDFDGKQDTPYGVGDETSTAADEMEYRPESICARAQSHDKESIQAGKKKEPLDFMGLPSEIRNNIYEKALTRPDGKFFIDAEHSTKLCRRRAVLGNQVHPFQSAASTRNLALLRTSKVIHAEAGAIIYGQKLVFPDLMTLQSFLAGLPPSRISLLGDVVLDTTHPQKVVLITESQHPAVATRDYSRIITTAQSFMPAVFALLAGADSLENLDPGIKGLGLASVILNNAMLPFDTISVTGWDATVARVMAAEVYCNLFTYLRRAVAVRGIDTVMGVLHVFDSVFREGPDCMRAQQQPRHVVGVEWTEERKAAMKKAMAEEIEKLLKEDNS